MDEQLGQAPPIASNEAPPVAQTPADGVRAWASAPPAPTGPTTEDRIKELAQGEKPGSAKHPFRTIDRESYLGAVRGSGIARLSQNAPIALVNLRDLVAIQGSVNAERVGHHLEDPALYQPGARAPGHGMLVDRPVVVRKNGMLFIHDGHHRLTARHLSGHETAKVRFVDLDAPR